MNNKNHKLQLNVMILFYVKASVFAKIVNYIIEYKSKSIFKSNMIKRNTYTT